MAKTSNMKKTFTFLSGVFAALGLSAQVCGGPAIIDEDFSNGIPAGWTVINNDPHTLTPSMILKGFTGQWQPYTRLGKKCLTNGSQMNASASCDDFLITPQFTVPVSGACLSWKASCLIPLFNESYEVMVSTTTPTVGAFTSVIAFPAEANPWTEHAVSLAAYAGQTVYVAFRHQAAGYAFFLDDIRISAPVQRDIALQSEFTPVVTSAGPHYFTGEMVNRGTSTVTQMDIGWSVDNGPATIEQWNQLSIAPDSAFTVSCATPWVVSASGTYVLRIWANNVNGTGDMHPDNDTLTKILFVNSIPRKPLFEEFTQASCPGCDVASWHADSVLNPYLFAGKATTIQYHVSWPGVDPMYSYNPPPQMGRVNHYGIAYVPQGVLDGQPLEDDCNAWLGATMCFDTNDVNTALTLPTIFDVTVNQVINGNYFDVQVNVTAHTDVPLHTLRLYTYLMEDTILYAVPPGTNNNQTDFYHVARYALPDTTGSPLPAMTNGQTITFNYTQPIDFVNTDPLMFRTLAFIQDDSTYTMYQSEVYPAFMEPTTGIAEQNAGTLVVHPNPATDVLHVVLNGQPAALVQWSICNVLGENVAGATRDVGGTIDVSALPPGVYFLNVQINGRNYVQRFVRA
jgi:hypothetical protein